MTIHSTAIVSKDAHLGSGVEVHPFAIIEAGVTVGDGCVIHARAHLCSGSTLGKNCQVHMNAVIGHAPQDFSYKGERITTILGDNVTVRENATIHGSIGDVGTRVGSHCFLMVGSHVAHDCKLGDRVLLANGALLAGHVEVEDGAFISGNVVIHQFVRVGRLAILSGGSRIGMDVPPYLIADGINETTTLNKVGLRRSALLNDEDRAEIKAAYKLIYRSKLDLKDALQRLKVGFSSPAVAHWVAFFESPSKRGFCRYRAGRRSGGGGGDDD